MKKAIAWSVTLFLNLVIIFAVVSGASSQSSSGDERVFPTGFVVRGEFLNFFDQHGGIETFGYPLTVSFKESGVLVQYFQRGRIELHPEDPSQRRVVMGSLGELLTTPEPPAAELAPHPDRRFFPETGHTVAAAFLHYFDERGGVDFFGSPITEMVVENGRIVQYFQRARLEWHPDNPRILRVQLGRLGEIFLDQFPPPQEALDPSSSGSRIVLPEVTSLNVTASVSHPFAGQNQLQMLYVFVYDQTGTQLFGAKVSAVIHFPDGDRQITLTETNESGLSWQSFNVGQVPVGETVSVEVRVSYVGVEGTTQTSFLVWL